MNKQGKNGIGWCDYTWNPVVGCLNNCEAKYGFKCYARGIAKRFASDNGTGKIHEIEVQKREELGDCDAGCYPQYGAVESFPYDFDPTFHRYRLDEPQKLKKKANIFVCSMADLFGKWVPDEWIEAVFDACRKAPQHNYLFLTKNGKRYKELWEKGILSDFMPFDDNLWMGITITKMSDYFIGHLERNTFISYEPILGEIDIPRLLPNWLIFGLETPLKKDNPYQWTWIEELVREAIRLDIPIYMKPSMMGKVPAEYYVQQFPKELMK